jgi:transcriptional regulator with XRE-family HTH domain
MKKRASAFLFFGGTMSRIKARREKLRVEFSQYHLAKRTGIPQTKISLIERELIEPTPDERKRIAQALGCAVEELWPKQEISKEVS